MSTEEAKLEWLTPSDVGNEFMRHSEAMELCKSVPVGKSFAIGPGYYVGMLRKMAEDFKSKKIVVIEHEAGGFEVRRLNDNANTTLFYASINSKCVDDLPGDTNLKKVKLLKTISEFLNEDDSRIATYDKNAIVARSVGCVTYTYFQRRLAAVAAFRKDPDGSSAALKSAIANLENESILKKLDRAASLDLIGTTATTYRINKQAIENE